MNDAAVVVGSAVGVGVDGSLMVGTFADGVDAAAVVGAEVVLGVDRTYSERVSRCQGEL